MIVGGALLLDRVANSHLHHLDRRADERWALAEQFIHAERIAIASSSEKSDIIQVVASD